MRHRTSARRFVTQIDCLESRNAPSAGLAAGLHHALTVNKEYIDRSPDGHRHHPLPPWIRRTYNVWNQHGSGFEGVDGGGGNGTGGFHS